MPLTQMAYMFLGRRE